MERRYAGIAGKIVHQAMVVRRKERSTPEARAGDTTLFKTVGRGKSAGYSSMERVCHTANLRLARFPDFKNQAKDQRRGTGGDL